MDVKGCFYFWNNNCNGKCISMLININKNIKLLYKQKKRYLKIIGTREKSWSVKQFELSKAFKANEIISE